ncbi:hypothetical protein [Anaerolentibacter hominis]|uniref:hypothetical protein n=1 Tax=Anaerolentibacter hominis TaxID=3079009 RepID=UPI0031B89C41
MKVILADNTDITVSSVDRQLNPAVSNDFRLELIIRDASISPEYLKQILTPANCARITVESNTAREVIEGYSNVEIITQRITDYDYQISVRLMASEPQAPTDI